MQKIYRFENGYGASVICTPYSFGGPEGLKELAVIKFYGPGERDWHINYDTPITDDVLGYLTDEEVEGYLELIKGLKEDTELNITAGDGRFEIIAKAKEDLIRSTNIETSEDEMKVLDSFLFRCWQMGWLDKYEERKK